MDTLRSGSIVVGVDESALAGQAVRWAAEQAGLEGRTGAARPCVPASAAGSDPACDGHPLWDVHVQHA